MTFRKADQPGERGGGGNVDSGANFEGWNKERDPRVVEHAWKTNEGGVIKFQSENKTPKNILIKWVDINEIQSQN